MSNHRLPEAQHGPYYAWWSICGKQINGKNSFLFWALRIGYYPKPQLKMIFALAERSCLGVKYLISQEYGYRIRFLNYSKKCYIMAWRNLTPLPPGTSNRVHVVIWTSTRAWAQIFLRLVGGVSTLLPGKRDKRVLWQTQIQPRPTEPYSTGGSNVVLNYGTCWPILV